MSASAGNPSVTIVGVDKVTGVSAASILPGAFVS